MDDMMSRISSLLENPESADKIKQIASSLGGDGGNDTALASDGDMSAMFSGSEVREVALLNAMKPYMRASRAEKIDAAIRALRMIRMLRNMKGF